MDEQKNKQVNIHYRFDSYLMHLIQETTKRPSAEIVTFFYELAGQVARVGVDNMTGKGIRKNIINYFPGTSIPFHMLVKGHHHQYSTSNIVQCSAEVGFPESRTYMREEELKNISVLLMENKLLGGEPVNLANFERPKIKTPRMFRELMESFSK